MKYEFKYHDFEELLSNLKAKKYNFVSFPEVRENLKAGNTFCLMRHDIDYDVHKALKIAEIEALEGVTSTFFFLLRTKKYNLLEKTSTKAIEKILSLGHKMGLHFDCAEYPPDMTLEETRVACQQEVLIIERWFQCKVDAVSFHRPLRAEKSEKIIALGDSFNIGVPHTYLPIYTREITYVSDSCGEWKYGHPTSLDAFKNSCPLHILIHPFWWNEQHYGAQEVFVRHLQNVTIDYDKNMARESRIYKSIDTA